MNDQPKFREVALADAGQGDHILVTAAWYITLPRTGPVIRDIDIPTLRLPSGEAFTMISRAITVHTIRPETR